MMSISDTLIDISHESSLNKVEKVSLRLIAKEVEKLQKRIKELEAVIQKCIDSMKGSNCFEERWLIKALKG